MSQSCYKHTVSTLVSGITVTRRKPPQAGFPAPLPFSLPLLLVSPGEGECLRGASDQAEVNKLKNLQQACWGLLQDLSLEHMFRLPPQPDYQSTADYVMQMMEDGFHISPSQALHSFAFIIPH